MPVRSTIHSSDVSTNSASSPFVRTRSGTCAPRPVIVMWTSLRPLPINGLLLASDEHGQHRLGRDLAVDARPALALRDRPAHAQELALEVEHVAGRDDALEAAAVDRGEEGNLALVRLVGEDGDCAALSDCLER